MREYTTSGGQRFPRRVAIGVGSNLGDRLENLRRAAARLGDLLHDVRWSSVYETEPVGLTEQPRFLNACCVARTELSPPELLAALARIETELGRVRDGVRFGPRVIDLDILLYGDEVVEGSTLSIPHPRMHERAFVLVPLAEVAPNWQHPLLGSPLSELAAAAMDEGVRRTPARLAPQ